MKRHIAFIFSGVAVLVVAGGVVWFWLNHLPVRTSVSISFGGFGAGTVTAPGSTCASDCTIGDYYEGSTITLTATPDASSVFAGWAGPSCSGTSPTCTTTLGASNRAIAYFRSSFKAVAVGLYHSCALRPAGNVVCWGRNNDGQLGIGHITNSEQPSAVMNITNAIAIAAGGYHTCVLIVDGTVQCWGNNKEGELGVGTFDDNSSTSAAVPGITEAVAVTAGGYHTCVVRAGGTAFCWGLNLDGQLGDTTTTSPRRVPVAVQLSAVGPLTNKIAAGGFHTCAIVAADSTVVCWGMNKDGQLGIGHMSVHEPTPGAKVQIDPSCGSIACGMIVDPNAPVTTVTFLKAKTIAASIGVGQLLLATLGGFHTVALNDFGLDMGWGNNNDGQLYPQVFPHSDPYAYGISFTDDPSSYEKIAAGAYHTCRLSMAAGVFCRGDSNDGQTGPSPPGVVPMTQGGVDLAAGGYHTCMVLGNTSDSTGTVACWGNNAFGQVTGVPTTGPVSNVTILSSPLL
jgi:alpha-tubulin suppressor-like RCC1 family protein